MDELRPDDVAARVAAWHNRHPLARRITPAQVQGVGWVALPFVQRPGAAPLAGHALPTLSVPLVPAVPEPAPSLRERVRERALERALERTQGQAAGHDSAVAGPAAALPLPQRLLAGFKRGLQRARAWPLALRAAWQTRRADAAQFSARRRALKAAYSEDFIAPLSAARTAGWALRHGRLHPDLAGQPVREVLADPAKVLQDNGLTHLYVATAAVELGSRRVRVLLGSGSALGSWGAMGALDPADPRGTASPLQVIGPRLLSPQRASSALAGLALVTLVLAQPMLPPAARFSSMPAFAQWPGVATLQAALQRVLAPQPAEAGLVAGPPADAASAAAVDAALADSAALAEAAASSAWASAEAAAASAATDDAASAATSLATSAAASEAASAAETTLAMAGGMPAASPDAESALPPLPPLPLQPLTPLKPDPQPTPSLPPDDPPPRAADAGRKSPWVRPLVAPLDEATKAAARQEVADLRAARGLSAPAPQAALSRLDPQAGTNPSAQPPPPAQALAEIGPSFALTTRPLRTRAESEQVQTAVRALLASYTSEPVLVELMPAGDDWRVVCWPFMRRQDAQLARALLLTRGLRLEAIEF